MTYLAPSTSSLQSTEKINQGETIGELQRQSSPHAVSIHILDNDSLLNVFYLYQSFIFGKDDVDLSDSAHLVRGTGGWARGHWWHKPAHVCQRWRNIILGSAFYLNVSLACTNGTPVADMLAHSPHLPLIVDYYEEYRDIATKDEEGAILALKKRDRIRRIRLRLPSRSLQRLIAAVDDEYPILEYLIMHSEDPDSIMMPPETLQAPHLRHLALGGFKLSIGSRLLTSAVGLVTLVFIVTRPDTYLYPNSLHHWLSFMPQLETLVIYFSYPIFTDDVQRQIAHTPIITPVTLPNLHRFTFRGLDTYLEAFVPQIITPRLAKLEIIFVPSQLAFSVPCLQQFISAAKNLKFDSATLKFTDGGFDVKAYPRGEAEMLPLSLCVECWHLDWQEAFSRLPARLFNLLSQMFSAVDHLSLEHEARSLSSEEYIGVDRTEWRKLLRSFRKVKTLHIDEGFVGGLSRFLDADDGELFLELLPELQELTYCGDGNTDDAFTAFVDARQSAGRPISLVRRRLRFKLIYVF